MDNFITKTTRSTTTPQTTTTTMSCSYNIKNNRNDIKNLNNHDINSNNNHCKRNNNGNNTDNNNNMKNTNNNMKNTNNNVKSNKNKCSCITLVRLALLLLINASFASCSRDRSKPAHLEAKVGSHVAFNCHIDFPYDIPISYVVHWSKDNKKIYTWYEGEGSTNELFHGRLHMVGDHADYGKASVNLTAIRESDQGWYHCQIIFPNRSPSIRNNGTWYHLTVQGGSLIKIPPVNQTIMEGQTAFFHCVMKFPDVSVVAWFKDGVPLKDMQELQRRSYMGPDGSLSIDPTMMSDLGEYECHVSNNQGDVQTAKGFLNIQYKAKVIYAPPEVFLPYGQPAVLDCHFRSNPPLKNLRWEKDGLLFDSYNVPGVFYKMNGSLFFSKVDENHAGSYTCTPYNDLGTDGPSPVISVIVLRPPIFSVTPKAIYIQKLGEVAELPCQAIDRDGNNRPNILWSRKDGVPLPEGRHVNDHGNLTITQLTESDRGMYECSATNEAATITAETELMIENMVPRPPYNLSANSTETTIALRWQPDDYLKSHPKIGYLRPNLEYTVWYRLTDMPEWRTQRVLNKNVMEATLSNLLSGREYEFMVLSQDKHGDGMFSKQIRFSTLPAQPVDDLAAAAVEMQHGLQSSSPPLAAVSRLSPPRNLTALPNAHGWLLHWQHPEHGSDTLRLYTVRWWEQPEHMLVGTAETLDNFYQMRHLKEEATFMLQVHAMSNEGEQVASDELLIEVPSHRKMRALAIGSVVGIIFLICALGTFIYVKRSCLRHLVGGSGGDRGGIGSAEHMKDTEKMSST